jgi:hypothetical protein
MNMIEIWYHREPFVQIKPNPPEGEDGKPRVSTSRRDSRVGWKGGFGSRDILLEEREILKKSLFLLMAVLVLVLGLTGLAQAYCSDYVTSPTGYFTMDVTQFYDDPYYRGYGQDWSWSHNGICSSGVQSAWLYIGSWDVDSSLGEVDNIYAYETTGGSWVLLGTLSGFSDGTSSSVFSLPSSLFDEVQSGLQLKIEIDVGKGDWKVTLLSSDLEASCAPLPGTLMLLGSGLLGLAGLVRFRKS